MATSLALRSMMMGPLRAKTLLLVKTTARFQQLRKASKEFPQPFQNMPFSVTNRYAATVVFAIMFGVPFWAPFVIVYYQYLKKSL